MAGKLESNAAFAGEVAELQTLLAQAKAPGNQRDLAELLQRKQQALESAAARAEPQQEEPMQVDEPATLAKPELPVAEPLRVAAQKVKDSSVVNDVASFTEISRFGWEDDGASHWLQVKTNMGAKTDAELLVLLRGMVCTAGYGKNKVVVYIMSGVDGVGALPKESVTCNFTKTSFDLQIFGLGGKNFRLLRQPLEKSIDPAKSSFRVKKNRVTISLWKASKDETWMNLTAKGTGKPKSDTSDPAAGIMDMMKNMYDEGDDNMKRTIAQAWSESRNKSGAAGAGLGL